MVFMKVGGIYHCLCSFEKP